MALVPRVKQPGLEKFIAASVCIHLAAFGVQGLLPRPETVPATPPPIQVKFVEPEKSEPRKDAGTIVDAPLPEIVESPNTLDLLSNANSRVHANLERQKSDEYRNDKTVVPKARGVHTAEIAPPAPPKEKIPAQKPRKVVPKKAEPYPVAEKGIIARAAEPEVRPAGPVPQSEPAHNSTAGNSAMALLDGFDPAKYAAMDSKSGPGERSDDDKPISLNTNETRYVSYFARIKQQIERVWIYPVEAAQRGISGELTLRFQISREGNLIGLNVVDKSGSEILDYAAIKAVKGAAPFYPIPSTIDRNQLTILATFIYSPNYASANR
ncbi:MAG: energy transducer TonB [Nitrospinae bacterium]|nr:energy transducer TonB [Nitrospinota bacterium]